MRKDTISTSHLSRLLSGWKARCRAKGTTLPLLDAWSKGISMWSWSTWTNFMDFLISILPQGENLLMVCSNRSWCIIDRRKKRNSDGKALHRYVVLHFVCHRVHHMNMTCVADISSWITWPLDWAPAPLEGAGLAGRLALCLPHNQNWTPKWTTVSSLVRFSSSLNGFSLIFFDNASFKHLLWFSVCSYLLMKPAS